MTRPIRLDDSLDAAVGRTFEGMAFTQVVRRPDAGAGSAPGVEVEWASIEMIEPAVGALVLVVDARLGRRLESVVTGAESGDGPSHLEVLGEMLNALAGSWARIIAPDERGVSLGLPKTGRGRWGDSQGCEIAVYETDEQETVWIIRAGPPS